MTFRAVVVTLILMESEVELCTMLHDRDIK